MYTHSHTNKHTYNVTRFLLCCSLSTLSMLLNRNTSASCELSCCRKLVANDMSTSPVTLVIPLEIHSRIKIALQTNKNTLVLNCVVKNSTYTIMYTILAHNSESKK